jgi:hypothetical protein
VYFREPNGILFEIATDDPGFAVEVLSTWRRRGKAAAGAAVTPVHISP